MEEPTYQTVLTYIPSTARDKSTPPFVAAPFVAAVKTIRARLKIDLKKAIQMVQPVRGREGKVVIFIGSLAEADEFARDLTLIGCGAHTLTVTPTIPPAHAAADQLRDLKDQYAHRLGGNEQAAFRTVIDTLREIGNEENFYE